MFDRSKIILGFAFLGFLAGISAYVTYKELAPILVKTFPFLVTAEWFLSGLVGTAFTLVVLLIWASVSKSK